MCHAVGKVLIRCGEPCGPVRPAICRALRVSKGVTLGFASLWGVGEEARGVPAPPVLCCVTATRDLTRYWLPVALAVTGGESAG